MWHKLLLLFFSGKQSSLQCHDVIRILIVIRMSDSYSRIPQPLQDVGK